MRFCIISIINYFNNSLHNILKIGFLHLFFINNIYYLCLQCKHYANTTYAMLVPVKKISVNVSQASFNQATIKSSLTNNAIWPITIIAHYWYFIYYWSIHTIDQCCLLFLVQITQDINDLPSNTVNIKSCGSNITFSDGWMNALLFWWNIYPKIYLLCYII